jgi:hypothetical protein
MLSPRYARFIATPSNAVPVVREVVSQAQGFVSRQPQGKGVSEALRFFLNGMPA